MPAQGVLVLFSMFKRATDYFLAGSCHDMKYFGKTTLGAVHSMMAAQHGRAEDGGQERREHRLESQALVNNTTEGEVAGKTPGREGKGR